MHIPAPKGPAPRQVNFPVFVSPPPTRLDTHETTTVEELLSEEDQLWEASENIFLVVNDVQLKDVFKDPEMVRRIQIAATFTQRY